MSSHEKDRLDALIRRLVDAGNRRNVVTLTHYEARDIAKHIQTLTSTCAALLPYAESRVEDIFEHGLNPGTLETLAETQEQMDKAAAVLDAARAVVPQERTDR